MAADTVQQPTMAPASTEAEKESGCSLYTTTWSIREEEQFLACKRLPSSFLPIATELEGGGWKTLKKTVESIDIIGRGLEPQDHTYLLSFIHPEDPDEAKHTEEKEGN